MTSSKDSGRGHLPEQPRERAGSVALLVKSMSPSRLFILRPVATTLLMAAIMLVGMFAYRFLPLSALPEVDYPTIQVQTFYPGASPDVMVSSVTAPLEVQFGQMPGLNQMSSMSSAGASVITLQFSLDLNLDVAEQEVQAAINAAGNLLPSDLPAPPIYAKVNPADAPVLTLALTSKTMPLTQVEDSRRHPPCAEDLAIAGGRAGQRSAAATGRRCASRRTIASSPPTVSTSTICARRSPTPTSTPPKAISTGRAAPTRSTPTTRSRKASRLQRSRRRLPQRRAGQAVGCRAGQGRRRRTPSSAAWMNTDPAVIVNIQRQPGANVIEVVDRIQALLPQLRAALPAGVDVEVLTDRTTTIRASVADVEFELGLAVVLVVLVIFVFLRSPSATLIPSLSVPLSLVGTLAVMYLAGFSLNNLSLMALDDRDRLRRRRRDRHDREHLALYRGRRPAVAGGVEGLGADRLHDHFADGIADRGADPASCSCPMWSGGCSASSRSPLP